MSCCSCLRDTENCTTSANTKPSSGFKHPAVRLQRRSAFILSQGPTKELNACRDRILIRISATEIVATSFYQSQSFLIVHDKLRVLPDKHHLFSGPLAALTGKHTETESIIFFPRRRTVGQALENVGTSGSGPVSVARDARANPSQATFHSTGQESRSSAKDEHCWLDRVARA